MTSGAGGASVKSWNGQPKNVRGSSAVSVFCGCQYSIPKVKILCNLDCLQARLRLLCNKYQQYSSLNLVSKQLKLCNIFIFGMAY